MTKPDDRPPSRLLILTSAVLTSLFLASRLPLLTTRRFDGDELEHAHVAWYLLKGAVPYRDFFEHHTLLFHYLLAAFFSFLDPELSADNAFNALFAARHLTWALSVGIVAVTFVLARKLRDRTTAWVAMPILAGNIVIALRAIEIRPDGLSTVTWLCSLLALYSALAVGRPATPRTRRLFCAAGVLIGLAVLTSQKLLLAGPPIGLLLVWHIVGTRFGGTMRQRIGDVAWHAGGLLFVWVAAVSFFAAHGAARDFLRLTVFEGVRWNAETTAASTLAFVTQYDPWLFALAGAGAVVLVAELRREERQLQGRVLLISSSGMFAGLFLIPVPYPQYCLVFIPLFAILAAGFLVHVVRSLAATTSMEQIRRPPARTVGAVAAFVALAGILLGVARPIVVAPIVYPLLVGGAVLAALTLPFHRRQSLTLVVVLLLLSVIPAQAMRWMAELGDRGQFAELRYVLDRTRSGAIVLDGWSGYGVFRRHAIYYWMLHPGVRAMLSPADVDRLVEDLTSGRVRPDLIVFDEDLRQLSTRFSQFVEAEYERVGAGPIYVRR